MKLTVLTVLVGLTAAVVVAATAVAGSTAAGPPCVPKVTTVNGHQEVVGWVLRRRRFVSAASPTPSVTVSARRISRRALLFCLTWARWLLARRAMPGSRTSA